MSQFQSVQMSQTAARIVQSLSPETFRALGAEQIAYLKPVTGAAGLVWSVYAADGRALSVHPNERDAAAAAREQSMISVHTH